MSAPNGQEALSRAEALISEILNLLATVSMAAETRMALETEFLTLRLQVDIIRKALTYHDNRGCYSTPTAIV